MSFLADEIRIPAKIHASSTQKRKMATKLPTYRALDLGFGYTKFSAGHFTDEDHLDVAAFPSYAGPALEAGPMGGGLTNAKVINVKVGDETFSVGEDSRKTSDGQGRQILEASFFRSRQYLALARGAMAFMRVPAAGTIDTLVMGLPLNLYKDESLVQHVTKTMTGQHIVPNINDTGKSLNINVKRASVIPQVVGSLISLAREDGEIETVSERQNLTIDVGYGTLLWLVSSGFTSINRRSDGNMGGVSGLLQKIIRSVAPAAVTNLTIMDRLDRALRENQPTFMVEGREVEISKHRAQLESAIQENLTEMLRSVGQTADIDAIYLTGGGAHLYKQAVEEAFKGRKIHLSQNYPRYTNVRGFQYLAETDSDNE